MVRLMWLIASSLAFVALIQLVRLRASCSVGVQVATVWRS